MKKLIIPVLSILCCCTTMRGESSTAVYRDFPSEIPVYIGDIILDPPYILDGISEELPDLVKSCLLRNGFTIAAEPAAEVFTLNIYIHSRQWHYKYAARESVTLRLSLSVAGTPAAYRMYTEDTDRSIDSFPWTFTMLDNNIRKLASSVRNDE